MFQRLRLPLIVLLIALLALFHRLLLGEVFFWGLPSLQFYPWRDYAFDLIRRGQLPLWNPYNGAGAPLFANYQSALLYPFNWLTFFLPLAWSMSLLAVAHLFLAGWGMWAFTARLGLTPLGRGMSALAFALTGYLVGRLGTYPIIMAAAWLPWLMWAALCLLQQFKRRDGGWLALFAGLMLLAGHAQMSWYALLLAGVFSLWYSLTQPLTPPFTWWWERLRRIGAVAALLLLGAGLAALQLIPTAELLATSQRGGGVDYEFALNFSYHPLRALNLLSPNIFGSPAFGTYNAQQGVFFEYAVYVGLIPLVSSIAALLHWLRGGRQSLFISVPFWWIIIIVAFTLAMGQHSPVFPFLFRYAPTFDLFQAPVRWHLWTVFALAVLAGIGVSAWGRGARTRRWSQRAVIACGGVVILLALALPVLGASGDNSGMTILVVALMLTCTFGALAGLLTLRQPEATSAQYPRWSLAVLGVVALDLVIAGWGLNPTVTPEFYQRREAPTARAYWFSETENTLKFEQYFTFSDYRVAADEWEAVRASNLPNLNLIDRAALLNNFDPLLFGSFAAYLDLIETRAENPAPLLQAAGVEAIYDETGEREAFGGTRAWLARSVCWHTSAESLEAALLDPAWNPAAQLHILGDGGCPEARLLDALPDDALTLTDEGWRVTIDVNAPRPLWLALADIDYPGWHASLNGDSLPIYRANLAFRAVQVPAGQSTVTFEYGAWWLLPGAILSALALLALVVLFRSRDVTL